MDSATNGVMLQYFHWYYPSDGLWRELAARADSLAAAGFTAVWIPPTSKGALGANDVGYAAYDLFDLGEFEQKGSIRTKYGTRWELEHAIAALERAGVHVYADVVFNHKDGADEMEEVWGQEVDWNDRNRVLSDWYPFQAWTRFTFPARKGAYSAFEWSWWCFDGMSYNALTGRSDKLYRVKAQAFDTEVSPEHGNFDYLLANNIDVHEPRVKRELIDWGKWLLASLSVDGFRIDACKHIPAWWFPEWLGEMRAWSGRELFSVGEYWSGNVAELHWYIERTRGCMSLFDVPLHFNFNRASRLGQRFDLRTLFNGSLVREQPALAVTFVDNHDTQPHQQLFSPVEPWFKPHAYAAILLRREGYPCVFYPDYFGAEYDSGVGRPVLLYSHRFLIDRFLQARRSHNFGAQHDYLDDPSTIGWVRTGDEAHPGVMAVVMTTGEAAHKWMNTFRPGATFRDVTGHIADVVTAGSDGWARFGCRAGSVSVWLT